MRLRSLGSGSTGNASLVESTDGLRTTRVLLDCGFSQRELAQRLARAGVAVEQIDAIFVTHEHGDHVGCALALSRRHRIPLWMSRGTWRAVNRVVDYAGPLFAEEPAPADDDLVFFARDGECIDIDGLRLVPYTVPHDAQEPLQVTFTDGSGRLGVLTDAGCLTAHILANLSACDSLLLESNHDPALLAASAYPASLKARISGRLGHLSNPVAAEILAGVAHPGLRHVVAAHLSERNNTVELARGTLAHALGASSDDIEVADPKTGTEWIVVA
ncbi:MBL fold metallo-hydrolase [Piscinibacter sakaiensis]|uniref:MBL fold metallo-hydrolase n=1 Tax=Piscinibacter sakaiensis TaxID=1547922 RepID=UPI003AAC735C